MQLQIEVGRGEMDRPYWVIWPILGCCRPLAAQKIDCFAPHDYLRAVAVPLVALYHPGVAVQSLGSVKPADRLQRCSTFEECASTDHGEEGQSRRPMRLARLVSASLAAVLRAARRTLLDSHTTTLRAAGLKLHVVNVLYKRGNI